MYLEEFTDREIKKAASELFYKNEENFRCFIKEIEVDRDFGTVTLQISESKNGPVWEETKDFEDIEPFVKIDDDFYYDKY